MQDSEIHPEYSNESTSNFSVVLPCAPCYPFDYEQSDFIAILDTQEIDNLLKTIWSVIQE